MSWTHKALKRAERIYDQKLQSKSSHHNIESSLDKIGLGKKQILGQNFGQLKISLNQLNSYLSRPEAFLKEKLEKMPSTEAKLCNGLTKVILMRKKLVLDRIDKLVTKNKIETIGSLAKQISDKQVRAEIENKLEALRAKDSFLLKEYGNIARMFKKVAK